MSKPPVAVYARISQDRKKTENGVSVQKQDCMEYAAVHGLEVVEVITENDVSAAGRKQRKGFEKLKKLAMEGAINGVVVWHPDRLYRIGKDLEDLIDICDVYSPGFRVHAVQATGVDLDTSSGRQQARILTAVSQHEIEHKAERQSRAQLRVFAAGDWGGGRPPTGYKRGDQPGTLVIDDLEADALRQVVTAILSRQNEEPPFGITAATRMFRELTGRRSIKPVSLRGTLLGPSIVALRAYLPEKEKRAAVGKNKPIPVGTYGPANWAPIIDHSTQNSLAKIIGGTPRLGRPVKSLLSGLLICGRCGVKMGYSKASYKCNFTAGGCGRVSVSTQAIETHIIEKMDHIITHGQFSRHIVPPVITPPTPKAAELEALRIREEHLLDLFTAGDLEPELLAKGRKQLKDMKAQLVAAGSASVAAAANKKQQAINAAARWQKAGEDISLRRTVIAAVWPEIIIRPTTKGKRNGMTFDGSRVTTSRNKSDNLISTRLKMKYQIEQGKIAKPPNPNPLVQPVTGAP